MELIPTILYGGAGLGLWPVSREFHPNPIIRLFMLNQGILPGPPRRAECMAHLDSARNAQDKSLRKVEVIA